MNIKFLPALLLALLPIAATASAEDSNAAKPVAPAVCPVSGEEIGSMGDGYAYTLKTEGKPDRTVMLCCKSCVTKLTKNPDKYLKQDKPADNTGQSKSDEHAGHSH